MREQSHRMARALIGSLLCFTAIGVSDLLCAQASSITYYGITCGPQPPSGMPKIVVHNLPRLGQMVSVQQTGMKVQVLPGCIHLFDMFLAFGSSQTQLGNVPLPVLLPLSLTGSYPCWLWTSADYIGGPQGIVEAFIVPNDPALIGKHLYIQWFVYSWNTGPVCWPYYQRWFTSDCADLLIGR